MDKKVEKILVLIIDFITINVAFAVFRLVRVQSGWFYYALEPEFFVPMLVIYFYWLLLFTFVGMYRTWFATSRFDEISALFKAIFVGVFILFMLIYIDDSFENTTSGSRILIFIYWGTLVLLVSSGRIFLRTLQRKLLLNGIGRRKAIIVGFNNTAFNVEKEIISHRYYGIDIEGFVTIDEKNIGKDFNDLKVLGHVDNILTIIDNYNINDVIIAVEDKNDDLIIKIISECDEKNVGLKIVPQLYDILTGQAKTSQLYGIALIDIMPQLMPEWEKKVKRILDIIIAVIGLILSTPIIVLTAIAIKLDSPGPVLFKQKRCGLNGMIFNILKFRSMQKDAEKYTGPIWSKKEDPRVTRVGRFIRKARIDEIPQMFNVLKGEMSLVGPRPERPYFVEKLSKEIPYYKRRFKVRPGITGWAQVKHKYDESIEDVKIKLHFDLFYIENISLRMDFKILLRTIVVILFGKGH